MNKNYKSVIAYFMMLFILASTPAISFAKEKENEGKNKIEKLQIESFRKNGDANENKKENEGKNKNDDNKDRGCFKAFGHLIAPGWIKHNGNYGISDECHFPFGINKKFRGNNATSTPDTIAPIISNVKFRTAKNQAVATWTTNEKSNSTVLFGTTTISQNGFTKNHVVVLKHLNPRTTYSATVSSRDFAGNISTSQNISFITKAPSADISSPVISSLITITSTSTIKVAWKTNENSTDRVYYSQTLPVVANASTTAFIENTVSTKEHVVTIPNLNPNTTYYIVVESTDSVGNVSTSATFTAVTHSTSAPVDVTAPIISSVVGTVGTSTTNITWTTNELSTSKVYYSTSTPVIATSTTPFINLTTLTTNHLVNIPNLATSTLYHFLIQSNDATNNIGTVTQFPLTTGN